MPRYLSLVAAVVMVVGGLAGCKGDSDKGSTTTGEEQCTPLAPVPRRIWRLSVQQYSNSVRDLLGLTAGPTLDTTGGTSESAFFSDASATVDQNLAFQMNLALRLLLDDAADQIPALAACQAGESEDACAGRFIRSFGLRAFRRPLDDGEVAGLMGVYAEGRTDDFNTGISLVIQALLQSPSFTFRSELGGGADTATTLTPYEVASQLSYTFLDSTPDQGLLDAAASGALAQQDGIAAQVDRLLATPAVQQNISRITLDWFNTRQLFIIGKSAALFSSLAMADQDQSLLQNDLYTSARALVDDILWSGTGKVTDLITSDRLFVNQRLATLYGLPFTGATPDAFAPATTTEGLRAGLLTHPAVLWAASGTDQTSIVHRGILGHNDIVCTDPLPFPEGLITRPDIQAALAALPTEIEKSDYRLTNMQCSPCHSQIDPYGRVLENFDAVGRFRTMADGLPVDPSGDFSKTPGLEKVVNGPVELAGAIIDNGQFMGCAAQKMASYAIGRMIRVNATCEVRDIRNEVAKGDGTIASLFRQVAKAPFVRARAAAGGGQ